MCHCKVPQTLILTGLKLEVTPTHDHNQNICKLPLPLALGPSLNVRDMPLHVWIARELKWLHHD